MENYSIQMESGSLYDSYHIVFENGKSYTYYEKVDSSFVNRVFVMVGYSVSNVPLLENSIYVFSDDFLEIHNIICVLNQEFNNLQYYFVLSNFIFQNQAQKMIDSCNLDGELLSFLDYEKKMNYSKKKNKKVSSQYSDYDLSQNVYVSKDDHDDKSILENKDFVQYNGYNQRLIQDNVQDIVRFNKKDGGEL